MITRKLRNQIRERDKGRCQECGLKVGKETGFEGHLHHILPKSDGGDDQIDNLITLCFFCHATKILKHRQLIEKKQKNLSPQFIKWAVWEIGLNLAYSGFCINANDFPKQKIAESLNGAITALEGLQSFINDIVTDGEFLEITDLQELFESIRIAHISHHTQQTLDGIILDFQSGD